MDTSKPGGGSLTGGTLEKTALAEALRSAYATRGNAQVLVSYRGEERSFWFHRGRLVSASSNREAQLVGELLRAFGLADESVLFAAFEKALSDPGRGLAHALRDSGAVAPFVADACVKALAEKVLYSSFQWGAGTFSVVPMENPPDVPAAFDQTTATLMLEGLRRLPPVLGAAPKVDPKARLVLSPDLLLRYQCAVVTQEEAEALEAIDGSKPAADVCLDLRVIERLCAVGLVAAAPPSARPEDPASAGGHASLNVEVAGAPPSPRLSEILEQHARLVWNTYRRLDWINAYELLGVSDDAQDGDLQRAVHDRARLFHPDNAVRATLRDAGEALEALFAKVREAEKVFASNPSRQEYDRTLNRGTMSAPVTFGEPTPEVQRQVSKANYERAKRLFEAEDYFPAYEMMRSAVEFDPDRAEYWVFLSKIQARNPKWVRQATETLRRAAARLPESIEVWLALAEACARERNEPERVKALKEVLKLDPTNRKATKALAEIAATKPR
jgi:tetratricopeptide (TPR) repeat protein